MKTLIAIPAMDQNPVGFTSSLATLDKQGDVAVSFLIGSLIYDSRNKLAVQAIKGGFDYVMWFDSDMVFESDTMTRLQKHLQDGYDIVTGLYFRRTPPYTPVLFSKLEVREDGIGVDFADYNDYPSDRLFEVAGCGFGCVIMKTEVLVDIFSNTGNMFQPFASAGEDIAFCIRARERGYKIFCDPTVKLGHVGHAVITESFYNTVKDSGK